MIQFGPVPHNPDPSISMTACNHHSRISCH